MGEVVTQSSAMSRKPQDEVLVLVRRLVITALLAAIGYSVLSSASQGYCPGGFDADGGYVDRLGNPTDVAPSCINLVLRPSPMVYLAIALIVVWAITRAARGVNGETAALRVLHWAGPAVILVAVLSVVLTQVSFISIPLESWDPQSGAPYIPNWLAVDIVISPMQGE